MESRKRDCSAGTPKDGRTHILNQTNEAQNGFHCPNMRRWTWSPGWFSPQTRNMNLAQAVRRYPAEQATYIVELSFTNLAVDFHRQLHTMCLVLHWEPHFMPRCRHELMGLPDLAGASPCWPVRGDWRLAAQRNHWRPGYSTLGDKKDWLSSTLGVQSQCQFMFINNHTKTVS